MSEFPGSQAQSSTPEVNGVDGTVNGVVGTVNGVLQENMTKLQEIVVSTTYTINVTRILECLFGHNSTLLILPISYLFV